MRQKKPRSWIQKHIQDKYYQLAKKVGYRARSAFKLKQIANKYPLFKVKNHFPSVILDLGCSPGSWIEIVMELYNETELIKKGLKILGIDLTTMRKYNPEYIEFYRIDILKPECEQKIQSWSPQGIDLLLSDCAPKTSGIATDIAIQEGLVQRALEFVSKFLRPNGNILIKVFQSENSQQFIQEWQQKFEILKFTKPHASTPSSREIYLIGLNYRVK